MFLLVFIFLQLVQIHIQNGWFETKTKYDGKLHHFIYLNQV